MIEIMALDVPNLNNVNQILTYFLVVMVGVVGYLYKEKAKETKDLNAKIEKVLDETKEDLKFFSDEKTKSVIEVTTALNKVIMLLEQLKDSKNE